MRTFLSRSTAPPMCFKVSVSVRVRPLLVLTLCSRFEGLSANVEQEGYCDDGCFQYVEMSEAGHVTRLSDIPFKVTKSAPNRSRLTMTALFVCFQAILDDSHYYDAKTDVMWVQGSYDLREESERCSKDDADDCLLAIDGSTGKLINATRANDWTVVRVRDSERLSTHVLFFSCLCSTSMRSRFEEMAIFSGLSMDLRDSARYTIEGVSLMSSGPR